MLRKNIGFGSMICEGTPLCAAQNGWRIRHLSEVDNKQKMNILLAHAVNVHAHVPVALLGMNIEDIWMAMARPATPICVEHCPKDWD